MVLAISPMSCDLRSVGGVLEFQSARRSVIILHRSYWLGDIPFVGEEPVELMEETAPHTESGLALVTPPATSQARLTLQPHPPLRRSGDEPLGT